jgi:hypothetical protein
MADLVHKLKHHTSKVGLVLVLVTVVIVCVSFVTPFWYVYDYTLAGTEFKQHFGLFHFKSCNNVLDTCTSGSIRDEWDNNDNLKTATNVTLTALIFAGIFAVLYFIFCGLLSINRVSSN